MKQFSVGTWHIDDPTVAFGRAYPFGAPNDQASDNSSAENHTVEATDKGLFLEALGMASLDGHGDRDLHLTFEGAAEYYWAHLIEPLQQRR